MQLIPIRDSHHKANIMNNCSKISILAFSLASLTGCYTTNQTTYDNSRYPTYVYDENMMYPISGQSDDVASYQYSSSPAVNVPDSYYAGGYRSPVKHNDKDKEWVQSQKSSAYTIEIGDSEKPAEVAGKLQQTPKTERMAEIKYYRDGKPHYKGVFGTFDNQESAEKALKSLPVEVQKGASVKAFTHVQGLE
jgi:hypothetical protein